MARITIRDLCAASLKTCGAVGVNDTPSSKEIDDAFDTLGTYLENLVIDTNISPRNATYNHLTAPDGTLTFGYDPLATTAPGLIVGTPVTSISEVIDVDRRCKLTFLSPDDFAVQQVPANTHSYYTTTINAGDTVIATCNGAKNIQVQASRSMAAITLDTRFDTYFPAYYWGLVETGLAVLLGSTKYGTDVSAVAAIYQGRLKQIEENLYVNNTQLNASRNAGHFFLTGGF